MTNGDNISTGELARQVRDVFSKLESLATRLESGQFVRTDVFTLYRESVNSALKSIELSIGGHSETKADKLEVEGLKLRLSQLEDDKKWLIRLVMGFIVLAVLGFVFAATGGKT